MSKHGCGNVGVVHLFSTNRNLLHQSQESLGHTRTVFGDQEVAFGVTCHFNQGCNWKLLRQFARSRHHSQEFAEYLAADPERHALLTERLEPILGREVEG